MTESSGITLESLNIISKLLSDNAIYIFLAIVLIVFREAISGLFQGWYLSTIKMEILA
jgi:hypothetical protein